PSATWASAAVSWRASPANTSGGRVDSCFRTASRAPSSTHGGCCAAGRSCHDVGDQVSLTASSLAVPGPGGKARTPPQGPVGSRPDGKGDQPPRGGRDGWSDRTLLSGRCSGAPSLEGGCSPAIFGWRGDWPPTRRFPARGERSD